MKAANLTMCRSLPGDTNFEDMNGSWERAKVCHCERPKLE